MLLANSYSKVASPSPGAYNAIEHSPKRLTSAENSFVPTSMWGEKEF